MAGTSSKQAVRRTDLLMASAGVVLAAFPLDAAEARNFSIPAGRLDDAIARFGGQTGLTIGFADQRLGQRRTAGLNGHYSTREALRRLLAGTGASFRFINPRTVQIIAAPVVRPPRRPAPRPAPAPPPSPAAPPPPSEDIVVTASKQGTTLDRYAGSVDILEFDADLTARIAGLGTAAVIERMPTIFSTDLGPGRNKLFIRGVADSSFNGPTQSTVGQYLGDVRLTYSAPDPNLNLYDLERVEVLAGPQGTLYGTGAIGGIVRFVPAAADTDETSASAALGLAHTNHGSFSNDTAAMVNLPLSTDTVGLRAVGYHVVDGGYIDDPSRGLANINRTSSWGGRLALRLKPGDRWTIDLGAIVQNIAGRDGQYTLRGAPDLTRSNRLSQPYDNDYRLGHLTIAKRWDTVELVSATGLAQHHVEGQFDATVAGSATPRLYDDTNIISLLSHETRLTGGGDRSEWVAGFSVVRSVERHRRLLGDPLAPQAIAGVRNATTDMAGFGQYSLPLSSTLSAIGGARIGYIKSSGNALDSSVSDDAEPTRTDIFISPMFGLSWRPSGRTIAFIHYQQAARAGGLTVGSLDSAGVVQRFDSDMIRMIEAGVRYGHTSRDPLALKVSLAYSIWQNIQADLVDGAGLPMTANIGNGRIISVNASLTWRLSGSLRLDAAAFYNVSDLTEPDAQLTSKLDGDLPNVAHAGGRVALAWRVPLSPHADLLVDSSLRYVGVSQLGIGPPLDVEQGNYLDATIGARVDFGRFGVSLDLRNIGDVRSNRFAFGNPFGLADRNQITPLRPRTVRVGIDASF